MKNQAFKVSGFVVGDHEPIITFHGVNVVEYVQRIMQSVESLGLILHIITITPDESVRP